MKIKLKEITVKDLFKGYKDTGKKSRFYIKGKRKYARIVIRRAHSNKNRGGKK